MAGKLKYKNGRLAALCAIQKYFKKNLFRQKKYHVIAIDGNI
jgi:hypothetical protein